MPLFQGPPPEHLSRISAHPRRKTFPAGANIVTAEQLSEVVYVIQACTVRVHAERADGRDVILAILGAGEVLGEMSVTDSLGRSASVVALQSSTLLWMNGSTFQQYLGKIPVLAYNLARTLSGRLCLANSQILSLATLDVYGRVARQIPAFAAEYGKELMAPSR